MQHSLLQAQSSHGPTEHEFVQRSLDGLVGIGAGCGCGSIIVITGELVGMSTGVDDGNITGEVVWRATGGLVITAFG